MLKLYICGMHAGLIGTDEVFGIVDSKEPDDLDLVEMAYDHGTSYQEQDEYDEWEYDEPDAWIKATVTTLAELKEHAPLMLTGGTTFKDLVESFEKEGMVFTDK